MAPGGPTTRRTFLRIAALAGGLAAVGGAGVVGAETGVLPGRTRLAALHDRLLGDDDEGALPAVEPGDVGHGSYVSAARRGATVRWALAVPRGVAAAGLPLVVSLHGRGGDASSSFTDLGLQYHLQAVVDAGAAPFAVASLDGGDTYWHPRADGEDAGAAVLDELVPMLARRGLDTSRLAFFGWSMGGYGALALGQRHPRTVAVAASSAALWERYEDSPPVAFDDADDFARHGLVPRAGALRAVPTRIACGDADPFLPVDRRFAEALRPAPQTAFGPGAHTTRYWRRTAGEQLAFVAAALA